jgi:hypothetical protein
LGEDLKQMMSLRPGPLSRRRRDEPSFILSTNATFVIKGYMRYIDSPFGPQSDLEPYPYPYIYQEEWEVYRKNEDDLFRVYFGGPFGGFAFPGNGGSSTYFRSPYYNPRDYKSKIYVSFFRTDGDECVALVTFIDSGTGEAYLYNGSQGPQTWKTGTARMFLMDSVPGLKGIPTNDEINPLHAWQQKSTELSEGSPFWGRGLLYYAYVNRNLPWESAQIACPADPEFDESRISKIPGYIETRKFDFTGYPQTSDVLQYQTITLQF